MPCILSSDQYEFQTSSYCALLAILGIGTDIAACEVSTLQHELWDDAVELAALVSKALLASAKSTEIFGGLGDYIVIEVEVDAAFLGCGQIDVSLDSD